MKHELEISGKTYTLIANRAVSTLMEKCIKVDAKGNTVIDLPEKSVLFWALLHTAQPELSKLECEKILSLADEEYGIIQMNNAIQQMVDSVFTQGSNTSHKKISWLTEETTEEK